MDYEVEHISAYDIIKSCEFVGLFFTACSLLSDRLNKPMRCVLSREAETLIKGTRHPVLAKYKVRIFKC